MPIQVVAHGFEMTEALRTSCIEEAKEKLQSLAQHDFSARWTLSLERGEHIAHVNWSDGSFKGDATTRSADMYGSIRQCAKLAREQLKHAHEKRFEVHRRTMKGQEELVGEPISEEE